MKPLYTPNQDIIEKSNMKQFMRFVNEQQHTTLDDYDSLYEWSIEQSEAFWQSILEFHQVVIHKTADSVLENRDDMLAAKWFSGMTLNFAENLLQGEDDAMAIISVGEDGREAKLTYAELRLEVAKFASYLKKLGVTKGDRVAGLLPNTAETVIAMLAATSFGAIWSSCSPDFGVNGVLDRFGQISPKVLVTVDGYQFKGKPIDTTKTVEALIEQITSLEQVVLLPYLDVAIDAAQFKKTISWEDACDNGATALSFVPVEFSHPLYIMYSSGTTGKPKCIVHGTGGTLLQHLKELSLHTDLKPKEKFFFYTTCGWMMWNWLVSGLACHATLVLFEGAPLYPGAERLWTLVDEYGINHLGVSAKYISAVQQTGLKPRESQSLQSLRTILSTGSPLLPESFDYIYQNVKEAVQLASISGGTDIISCFALGCPILPVFRGELQCRGLGMAVNFFNDEGKAVEEEQAELVCTQPFPSQPVGFWQDDQKEKYKKAYFARFDNVWAHGDFAELTAQKGVIIYGRSDAVLNPGGVRIGTAEIYRQLETMPEIIDAVAVGQEWQDDMRVILFVMLKEGEALTEDLITTIKQTLRTNATPRHVPAKIIAVGDIPRTVNGKTSELAVKNTIHGRQVTNQHALANPESLALYKNLPELEVIK